MKYSYPILLVVLYFLGFKHEVHPGCSIADNMLYAFSHANILHLGLNIFAYMNIYESVTIIKKPFIPIMVIIGGFIAGFFATTPTVGCSGGLFFVTGIQIGYYLASGASAWWKTNWIIIGTIAITAFFPHIGAGIHIAGYLSGMVIGSIYGGINTNRKTETV